MKDFAVIGIDGGATATRAVVLDENGTELGRGESGPALTGRPGHPIALEAVLTAVKRAAKAADIELPAAVLCAGLAGVGRETERQTTESSLGVCGLASKIRVITDAEAALFDAHGDGPGLLLIAGTGSIAMGRAEDGREARAGGWGTLLGDEGGGYDIGLRALRAAAWAADGRGGETELLTRLSSDLAIAEPQGLIRWVATAAKADIAALAPIICEVAETGDGVAAGIIHDAVTSLERHVAALLTHLGPWSGLPGLALAGGLLAPGGPLRNLLTAALVQYPCACMDTRVEAVRGAARLALRDATRQTS
jgi:glucosamine kinase